jgi:hypothetical protein
MPALVTRVASLYIFVPKIPIWVNFGGPLNGKNVGVFMYAHLEYIMAIWYILWSFGVFYGHLVYFMVICILWKFWYIFPRFGKMCPEKSGNPAFFTFEGSARQHDLNISVLLRLNLEVVVGAGAVQGLHPFVVRNLGVGITEILDLG